MFFQKLLNHSRLISILFALCLGIGAQYLFTGEVFTHQLNSNNWEWTPNNTPALIMLLMATCFAIWAAFPRNKFESTLIDSDLLHMEKVNNGRIWLVGAASSYVASILLYLFVGENSLVRWLWVAGVVLLVIPLWFRSRRNLSNERIPSWEWIVVGLIALIGFGLRYWKLTEIPSQVDNDVALMGTFGLKLIQSGQYNWIGYSGSEHLLSYDQFMAWSMRLFGQNHYGIVMHSVVLGTLSLFLVFLLGREINGNLVGLVASGLLAISYTNIHFSRILFGNSSSFAAIFFMYAFLKGMRTGQVFWFALAGIWAGWGVLLYDSSRIMPLVILCMIGWQWLWQRQLFKSTFKNWGLLLGGAFISFGPMLAYAIQNFSDFAGRANVVSLWTPVVWEHELYSYNTTSPFQVLWQQTWRAFLTIHLTGDGSSHFAFPRPMVDPLTALLFVLGLGYGLSRIKNLKYFSLLVWIAVTFIFGGVLTSDPPYWPHLNIALPAIVLVAALGARSIADHITSVFGQVGYKVYSWVLVSVIIVTGINNWQIYYDYVKNNAGNRILISRYISTLPLSYKVYLFSPNFTWEEYAFRFFNQNRTGQSLLPEALETAPPVIDGPTVFILFKYPELLATLQDLYPEGEAENHFNFDSLVSFISYRVVPPDYEVAPKSSSTNPLYSTGWLLIFGFVVFYVGFVAYQYYSSVENLTNNKEDLTAY